MSTDKSSNKQTYIDPKADATIDIFEIERDEDVNNIATPADLSINNISEDGQVLYFYE
jgi:hypothetical protein